MKVPNLLASPDARFERHCEGGTAALHGKIHWTSGSNSNIQ